MKQGVCKLTGQSFVITPKEEDFYFRVGLPFPDISPVERFRNLMAFRNDRRLYYRRCDVTGRQLISMYSNDSPQKVVDKDVWWSDEFDAKKYVREIDWDRSFFDQFYELMISVPHPNLITLNSENCEYTNYNGWNRNCYLCFAGNTLADSLYCYNVENSNNCVDCLNLFESQFCYECVQSENMYKCVACLFSKNCSNSYFLEDCSGCRDCIFCYNLVNKQYCILNKQYSKEEYENYLKSLNLNSRDGFNAAYDFWRQESLKFPKKALHNVNVENCYGEYISNSKNCFNCYMVHSNNQDCTNVLVGFPGLKDSHSCCFSGENAELMYMTLGTGAGSYKIIAGIIILNSSEIYYSDYIINCKNCFGCSGLRNAEYCIFNKQYTKEEYEEIVPKLIEKMKRDNEWGRFLPYIYSPFAYNESVASDFFPLNSEVVKSLGMRWTDESLSENKYLGTPYLIPDKIEEVDENITGEITKCVKTGKLFKINQSELNFYKQNNLAIPNVSPEYRHSRRFNLKNKPLIYGRKCDFCKDSIYSSYDPARLEKVYCEKCYLELMYN